MQVFQTANTVLGRKSYAIELRSVDGGAVRCDSGCLLMTEACQIIDHPAHTLIIPGAHDVDAAMTNIGLAATVQSEADRAHRIASVCTGSLILACVGLLAGRRAATHWRFAKRFSDQFANVTLEPDAIYVRDDPYWSSAGVTAGIDLALAMVEADHARRLALDIARELVAPLVREGGQNQYSVMLETQSRDAAGEFDDLHEWITGNLRADLRVDVLAEKMAMSPRNFARRYLQAIGRSPAKSVEMLRIEAARVHLEQTNVSVSDVARTTGFRDAEHLRRAFRRHKMVDPTEFRKRFGLAEPR